MYIQGIFISERYQNLTNYLFCLVYSKIYIKTKRGAEKETVCSRFGKTNQKCGMSNLLIFIFTKTFSSTLAKHNSCQAIRLSDIRYVKSISYNAALISSLSKWSVKLHKNHAMPLGLCEQDKFISLVNCHNVFKDKLCRVLNPYYSLHTLYASNLWLLEI